ncbi:glycosyltransferase [Salarchaeum sp. III]|uniref:glycosyltransferase family 2 protein n=1 Tax=Salarchaeum sp. III TaxID=3107927 RepID=UPI002EDAD7CB
MDLSVVVPTLNARDRLAATLDSLGAHAPDAEVVVVNGPSADGTSGLVRDHPAVDILLELSERNVNAARNAGIAAATSDIIALVGQASCVREGWTDALRDGISDADAVTGPIHRDVAGGHTTEAVERRRIRGRDVTYFDGGNAAFTRDALEALDGFDEYLETGAARDAAHRLAGMNRTVAWRSEMAVVRTDADDVTHRVAADADVPLWGLKYRSLAYRLAKNYGVHPTVPYRIGKHAVHDALGVARDVLTGDERPSEWAADGAAVLRNTVRGFRDGLSARRADDPPRRNPNGISQRMDRTLARYD